MLSLVRAVAVRLLLATALLGAYFYAWRPHGRTAATRFAAAPLLRAAADGSLEGWTVRTRPGGRRIALQTRSGDRSVGWTAPAGMRFLLPALGLVLVAPRRLYWLLLWGGHLALGALGTGLLCLGMAGSEVGFVLYEGVTRYLLDAFSLGVATWAVVVEWDLGRPAPGEA